MIALVMFLFSIESRTIFLILRVVKENSLVSVKMLFAGRTTTEEF